MRFAKSPKLALLASVVVGLSTVSLAQHSRVIVTPEVKHDVSPAVRDLPTVARTEHENREHPVKHWPHTPVTSGHDGALQTSSTAAVATSGATSFAGVGNGDYGFAPNAAPPDTNGAVGATQYVQWVNESFAVFDKSTGTLVKGPIAGNSLWKGFGGGCEANNDGDPIVKYDQIANRWIFTQFSVSTTPYLQCVAVSTTSDATGTFNRYSFNYSNNFNDYPKLAVWPDAYYITFNLFLNGQSFEGAQVCAYDRTAMINGAAATQQCFKTSTSFGGLLPSDLDGSTLPPAGSPNYVLNFGSNVLNLWKFHVDFANPANTTFTGPTSMSVASFTEACGGGTCIPQPGTSEKLDSLADRLMYRLAYRHFADGHEALAVNHSVKTGGNKRAEIDGVRWYELRSNGAGSWSVFQQGTFSPDSNSRWMGSVAMDKVGDLAVGYSVSSGSLNPSIRFTGRVPTDALGTLQGETSILTGGGAQQRSLARWGDYSSLAVDPSDDCTLWYTTEYLKANGTFNWSTEISHFKFPGCQ
jgi:hypothetical protein